MPSAVLPGKIIRGSNGRIDFGGGFYGTLDTYSVDVKSQELRQESFESFNDTQGSGLPGTTVTAGVGMIFQDADVSILNCTVQISGYYDKNNSPFATPPSLGVGIILGSGVTWNGTNWVFGVTTIRIWVDKTSTSKYFVFSAVQVVDCKTDGKVSDRTNFSATLSPRGPWAYPGSS